MISYKIDENKILIVTFEGVITLNEIVNWLEEFTKIPNLPYWLNLIYDLSNADLDLDATKVMRLAKLTEKATGKFWKIRTAFLISELKMQKYSELYSFLKSSPLTIRKIYTDFNQAYTWILKEKKKEKRYEIEL